MMLQVGDWVVIRDDAPSQNTQMWSEKTMRCMADGFRLYKVSKVDFGWITLENPYNHAPAGMNAATYMWHESWLWPASFQWAAVQVPVSAPVQTQAQVEEVETGKGKSEGDKPQKLTYSQTHEIIPQHPGESDKAYLRRILGGR